MDRCTYMMNVKPQITVSSANLARLEKIIYSLSSKCLLESDDLLIELERAEIILPELMPDNVVTMDSRVKFNISSSEKEFTLTLVYPGEHNRNNIVNKISILTPVGKALLGLREGDEIEWPNQIEGIVLVKVVEVIYQPERELNLKNIIHRPKISGSGDHSSH